MASFGEARRSPGKDLVVIGKSLGPYQILAELGRGGMGEVYRAMDLRLGRTVAVKILSARFANDAAFRERFDREAKALSQLSHPHICTLHDVGEHNGIAFLVMEYIDGESLAHRLTTRSHAGLSIGEALRFAVQIGGALDAAHRANIIHRDLKPANIMITRDGGVKLMDFGLAKAAATPGIGIGAGTDTTTMEGTAARSLTAEGTLLGTLHYMAPEQLEGREADVRTDLFAFGLVIYEMVSGRSPFAGDTPASLIGAILKDEPAPLSSIATVAPPALDFVVRRSLEKNPENRWQSARDLTSQLEWIRQSGGSAATAAMQGVIAGSRRSTRWRWLAGAACGALLLAASFGAGVYLRSSDRPDGRFDLNLPEGSQTLVLSISPDSRHIVYSAKTADNSSNVLWLRPLDSTVARALPGTEGGYAPFWSPDGATIGFGTSTELKRVDISGGRPRTLCALFPPFDYSGGSWNDDGTILFSSGAGLYRIPAAGGTPVVVTTLDASQKERGHFFPTFLSDGHRFLYTAAGAVGTGAIMVASIDGDAPRKVLDSPSMATYVKPGYVIYQDNGALLAQRVNARSLAVEGQPVHLADNVATNAAGRAAVAVSADGLLVYRTLGTTSQQLTWFDRHGKQLDAIPLKLPVRFVIGMDLSADGRHVALSGADAATGNTDIWTLDLSTLVPTRITFEPSNDDDPTWLPDGAAVAFWSLRKGKYDFYRRAPGASADEVLFESAQTRKYMGGFSRDGKLLLFHDVRAIFAVPVGTPKGEPKRLLEAAPGFVLDQPHFSPDGQWVAYDSTETGQWETYVASYPTAAQRHPVSSGGGGAPVWSRDGKELFYMSLTGQIMSVSVTPRPTPTFGVPTKLFQTPLLAPRMNEDEYAVSADGRFLVLHRTAANVSTPVTVVLDWTKLLPR